MTYKSELTDCQWAPIFLWSPHTYVIIFFLLICFISIYFLDQPAELKKVENFFPLPNTIFSDIVEKRKPQGQKSDTEWALCLPPSVWKKNINSPCEGVSCALPTPGKEPDHQKYDGTKSNLHKKSWNSTCLSLLPPMYSPSQQLVFLRRLKPFSFVFSLFYKLFYKQ